MKKIRIGERLVGEGEPVYIILEAGPTHTGLDSAKRLAEAAAAGGADAVKFQMLDPDRLMADREVTITYGTAAGDVTESLHAVLKRREMPAADWLALKAHCDSLGITFFATPDFPETVDLIVRMKCHTIKVASGDANNLVFLGRVAASGLPVMLDTGSHSLEEIERAVAAVRAAGNERIMIMHCPSGYPARLESVNLRLLNALKERFDLPVGFCDHTPGWEMDVAAVARGVNLVEKTITLDRSTRSAEHVMSLEPGEIADFVKRIREVEVALGRPERSLGPEEIAGRRRVRRGPCAARDLPAGRVLAAADLVFRRPEKEIPADAADRLLGRALVRPCREGEYLTWEAVGGEES